MKQLFPSQNGKVFGENENTNYHIERVTVSSGEDNIHIFGNTMNNNEQDNNYQVTNDEQTLQHKPLFASIDTNQQQQQIINSGYPYESTTKDTAHLLV